MIDGTTGQPLAGVYVIGAWRVGGGLVIANTSCAKLDVVRTDHAGAFALPTSTGRMFAKLFGAETLNVAYYEPAYEVEAQSETPGPILLVRMRPDARRGSNRIGALRDLMAKLDCGDDATSVQNRLAVGHVIATEAERLAATEADRSQLSQIWFWLDAIEFGEPEARKRLDRRESKPVELRR